jgi:hypothetical protein
MSEIRRLGLLLILHLLLSRPAAAEVMSPNLPARSFGLGVATLYVEQPDSTSEQRYRWDAHEYERLPFDLRLHNRFGLARDIRPRADSIAVHHHFHELYSGLQWTGTRLFRYAIGAGPLLLLEQTITRIQLSETTERTNNRWQLGWLAEAELDYAFNDSYELALYLTWQLRPAANKDDISFGVSLQFNRGNVHKEAPGQVSTH